jgi:hypothetical protein
MTVGRFESGLQYFKFLCMYNSIGIQQMVFIWNKVSTGRHGNGFSKYIDNISKGLLMTVNVEVGIMICI